MDSTNKDRGKPCDVDTVVPQDPAGTIDGEHSQVEIVEDEVPKTAESAPTGETKNEMVEALRKEMLYLRAEFENYKKRMIREQQASIRFANEKFMLELLSVVDLFERALAYGEELKAKSLDRESVNLVTGIELTYLELIQVLNRWGVELIGKVNEPFDPGCHEAVSSKEVEGPGINQVVEILQKGCTLHGRLIKAARVVVGAKKGS